MTARVIPELESAVENLEKHVRSLFPRDPRRGAYVLRRVYAILRRRIRALPS